MTMNGSLTLLFSSLALSIAALVVMVPDRPEPSRHPAYMPAGQVDWEAAQTDWTAVKDIPLRRRIPLPYQTGVPAAIFRDCLPVKGNQFIATDTPGLANSNTLDTAKLTYPHPLAPETIALMREREAVHGSADRMVTAHRNAVNGLLDSAGELTDNAAAEIRLAERQRRLGRLGCEQKREVLWK